MKKIIWFAGLLMMSAPAFAEESAARSPFALPGIWWFALILAALLIAFIVVSGLRAQLKTAAQRDSAANYIRKDSLQMTVARDHFLYRKVTKRKIEQDK